MLVEMLLSRMPVPMFGLVIVIVVLFLYTLEFFIAYWSAHYWIYPFVDWSHGPIEALVYLIIAAAAIVIFLVMKALHWGRDRVGKMCGWHEQLKLSSKQQTLPMAETL